MSTINYSIIIPHYNIPHLLLRCINSIPNRKDIEIIIVDDCSDSEYYNILNKEVTKLPHNIQILKPEKNGGGGKARNIGLKSAHGKFILFADADDFFNYCVNDILDDYINTQYDIIFFNANCVDSQTYTNQRKTNHLNQYIELWEKNPQTAELYLRYMFGEPWCKMIRRNLITANNIYFDETRIHNDTTFSYLVGFYAQSIHVDKRALYTYTIREGSVSRNKEKWKYYTKIDVFGRSELFFIKHKILLHEDRHLKALYTLLRLKDKDGFNKGYEQLIKMGFNKQYINKYLAIDLAKQSILSIGFCLLFVPNVRIKIYCILYIFYISIPRLIKFKILRYPNNELKRY